MSIQQNELVWYALDPTNKIEYIKAYLRLKEPFRTQALHNYVQEESEYKNNAGDMVESDYAALYDNIQTALMKGFVWRKTEQGPDYWYNIYQNIYDYVDTSK